FLIQQVWLPWIQSHNHGISIEEWGDPNLSSDTGYANSVLSLVKTYGAAATYYQDHNAIWGNLQLSDVGKVLQQKYASLPPVIRVTAASPIPTATSSPADHRQGECCKYISTDSQQSQPGINIRSISIR